MHRLSIYRTLSIGPCARHCCYGSCINGKEGPARLDAVYTRTAYSDSTINSVPSAPIARRPPSLPCTWSRWSWACGLPPPRASYRSAPERVSSHAASFGHMMPGPSGPTTMSTWPRSTDRHARSPTRAAALPLGSRPVLTHRGSVHDADRERLELRQVRDIECPHIECPP
jgi:hypothetical protein